MSSSHRKRHEQIDDQAIAWLALLRGDSVTVAEQAEFAVWLASEPEHQVAFDELTMLWVALKEPLQEISTAVDTTGGNLVGLQHRPDARIAPAQKTASDKRERDKRSRDKRARKHVTRFALAASTVLTVAAGLVVAALSYSPINGSATERLAGLWKGLSTNGQHAVTTSIGEQRSLELIDGSQVTLNTMSSLVVSVDEHNRSMTLASGQAFFQVAKDESRPFRVEAGKITATAIGTAFSVQHVVNDDGIGGTTVIVEEGVVELTSADEVLRLGADQRAEVTGGVVRTSRVHADSATAWRHGQLIYSDVPLSTVISDLNRYLPHPMTIPSKELAAVKVSAVLQLSEQKDMLNALSHALPMRWQLMSDSLVIIHPTRDFKPEPLAVDEA